MGGLVTTAVVAFLCPPAAGFTAAYAGKVAVGTAVGATLGASSRRGGSYTVSHTTFYNKYRGGRTLLTPDSR